MLIAIGDKISELQSLNWYVSGEDNNADPLLPSPKKASSLYSFLSSSLANSTKFFGRGGGGGEGRGEEWGGKSPS